MKNDLVSIIIPTYNRAHLIGETLDSVIAQSYQNWECIIIDDNSTDNTEQVVSLYLKKDIRFQFYIKPKHLTKGPSSSRNFGFKKSKGEYVNWLDSDDLLHPKKLKIDLENIQSGNYDFTISQSKFFTKEGEPNKKYWNKELWSNDPINDFVLKKIGWGVNSPLWRKQSLEISKIEFDENLITADDYFYHIRALECSLKPIVNIQALVFLREHENRLNDYHLKSPFKLKVNTYLMANRGVLKLSDVTISFLNKQFIRQFANLLKNKQTINAKHYCKSSILNMYSLETRISIRKLLCFGVLYKHTGVGYRMLKTK